MTDSLPTPDLGALAPALLSLLQADDVMVSIKAVDGGRYIWANPALCAFLGVDVAGVAGRTDLDTLPAADAQAWRAADHRAVDAGVACADTHRFERAGERVVLQAWRCLIRADATAVAGMVAGAPVAPQLLTVLRIDRHDGVALQLQQAMAQIERLQAQMDRQRREHAQGQDRPSELFRQEHFDEHLRREVALSQREEREFALVLIAVDQAEALQRQHGEGALARVIESVGHLMRANTRAMDVLAQLGHDRFAILFSGIGLATAHNRVEQLRRACATELVVQSGVPLHFEISAGVATFPHSADSLAALSAAAQRALGDAQSRGGNRVALASIALRPPQVG